MASWRFLTRKWSAFNVVQHVDTAWPEEDSRVNAVQNVQQCLKARLSGVGWRRAKKMRVAFMFDYVSSIERERIRAYSVPDITYPWMAHVGTSRDNPKGNECSQYDENADDELVTRESARHFRLYVWTPNSCYILGFFATCIKRSEPPIPGLEHAGTTRDSDCMAARDCDYNNAQVIQENIKSRLSNDNKHQNVHCAALMISAAFSAIP